MKSENTEGEQAVIASAYLSATFDDSNVLVTKKLEITSNINQAAE